jgi:hypothetical protein
MLYKSMLSCSRDINKDTVDYATVLAMQKFEDYYSQHTRHMLKGTFCTTDY